MMAAQMDSPFDSIPEEMRQYRQWVCWKLVQKPNQPKPAKIPICPATGSWASVSDPSTWGSYDDAIQAYARGQGYSGIGFVFTQEDPFAFADFDSVKTDAGWDPLVGEALAAIPSWAEYSQSGTGLHIICKAAGEDAAKCPGLELYHTGRFVALTGRHVPTTTSQIREAPEGVAWLRGVIRSRGGQTVKGAAERPEDRETQAVERNLRILQHKPGKLEIECPWGHEHANGDPTGAVYMPAHFNGRAEAGFYCQHATCQGQGRSNINALRGWLQRHDPQYVTDTARSVFQTVSQTSQHAHTIDAGDLDLTKLTPRPWLYGHLVLQGYLAILHGPGGVGKSMLALTHLLAMASGRNLIGEQPVRPLNVMYVCNEDDLMEIKRRLAAIAQYFQINLKELPGRLTIVSGYESPFWMHSPDGGQIEAWVDAVKSYDVVGADPLISLHRGLSENSNEDMEAFMATLRTVIKLAGIGFIAVAHNRKGSKNDPDEESLRGASAQKDAARLTFVVSRMTRDQAKALQLDWAQTGRHLVQVYSGKLNFSPPAAEASWYRLTGVQIITGDWVGVPVPEDLTLQADIENPQLAFAVDVTKTLVLPYARVNATGPDISINEIMLDYEAEFMYEGKKLGQNTIRGLLKSAIRSGALVGGEYGHGPGGGYRVNFEQPEDERRPDWMD